MQYLTAAAVFLLLACSSATAGPQTGSPAASPQPAQGGSPEAQAAPGMVLTCEVYCSEEKLRTANARLSWRLAPGPALEAANRDVSALGQRLETTVYKDGFARGLYVRLPISPDRSAGPESAPALARQGQSGMRAYQLRLVEVAVPPTAERATDGAEEVVAVVENLEPGMNYTWRTVLAAEAREWVSSTVTCKAPICPADIVREKKP